MYTMTSVSISISISTSKSFPVENFANLDREGAPLGMKISGGDPWPTRG
jgi:hypothetical protein